MEGRPLEGVERPADGELVERARRGDAAAYGSLVERYQQLAFRTAYVMCGSAADAEEAAQDAFVKAHAALGRFRRGAPFRAWLLAIVANEARNRRRSAGRRAELALRVGEELSSGGAALSPEAALVATERRRALIAAVEALPPADRVVIACRYFLELSEEETAAVVGRRRGTVKSRTSRALDRLRARLEAVDA